MKNMTLAHITEVCGGIYFGPEERNSGSHGYRDGQPESREREASSLQFRVSVWTAINLSRTWLPRAHLLSFPSRNLKHRHARISS